MGAGLNMYCLCMTWKFVVEQRKMLVLICGIFESATVLSIQTELITISSV